eukprot:Blabericola_migrator_1__9963@NODE_550_length_7654_cov_145_973903_g415_i0_p4_GENE_NODE_550_length_7654_cov_145_973903_g415_i0NODE_550_length_7654_cov_145_973903_g415_i0_p4_ORF_typecomplete_len136_score22_10C2/PF00168_30/1_9e14_NODE_550_length_7654_cov_145_973903_g415_i072177624
MMMPPHGQPHFPPQGPSQIVATVISAFNMPKKVGFGDKTDPYVELQLGAQKLRTSTKIDAGSEAQFNETLRFAYNGEPSLVVHLYDEDKKKSQLIGSGTLELTRDIFSQGYRGVIHAYDKKEKVKGDVLLHVQAC